MQSDAVAYAVGVAVSPVPIGAGILLLSCRDGIAKGSSFALGWTAGVAATVLLLSLLAEWAGLSDSDPLWIAVPELALGAAFIIGAVLVWQRRERRAGAAPRWLDAVEGFSRVRSAGIGVVVSSANPKVLALSLGAALALAQSHAGAATTTWTLALFTAVGAVGVAVPVAIAAATPDRSQALLGRLRAGLVRHEAAALIALGLGIGTLFLVDGLRTL